mgnify:CR=1 FL=1
MGWPFDSLIKEVYLPYFQKHGELAIPALVNGKISSMAFLSEYKKLSPIEEMPEQEKKEMKLYVIKMFSDKTIEEKLNACKIIYTIGNLL